jgi:hypothetical protein
MLSSALNMNTVLGKKILQALTDYGAYLVDDTAWNVASIVMDVFVHNELQQTYNITTHSWNSQSKGNSSLFYQDLLTIFKNLEVVINNGLRLLEVEVLQMFLDLRIVPLQLEHDAEIHTSDLKETWVPTWNVQTDAVNEAISIFTLTTSSILEGTCEQPCQEIQLGIHLHELQLQQHKSHR